MLNIRLTEYQAVPKETFGPKLLDALQSFDEQHAKSNNGESVFDWKYLREIRAKNWVGVISIPGLSIEIVPKVSSVTDGAAYSLWRTNLIYMLCYSGALPFSFRDYAALKFGDAPLLEAIIELFAEATLVEIRKGIDRGYVHREERSLFAKGKILLNQNMRSSITQRHRLYVAYDEFSSDTQINRILKVTCRHLLRSTKSFSTQQKLREISLLLGEVEDVTVYKADFEKISFSRSNQRYETLTNFCRQVLAKLNPNLTSGDTRSFSLLFPMEQVFEAFIATFIRRNCIKLGLPDMHIVSQYRGKNRYLLTRLYENNLLKPSVPIRPDIMVRSKDGRPTIILDTKWKLLRSDAANYKNDVAMSDLYQIYAYAQHFDCNKNILLFPSQPDVTNKRFRISAAPVKHIYIRQVDLDFNLMKNTDRLLQNLKSVLS